MSNNSNSTTSKTETFNRYRVNRPVDIVNIGYLLFISSVYSLYMHDMYFDITGTRASTFIYGTLMYIILIAVSFALEVVMIRYYGAAEPIFYKDSKWFAMPEMWMIVFMLANFTAFLMSDNKAGSWSGDTGRFFGLGIVMVITFMFVFLSRETCTTALNFVVLAATATCIFVLACVQHFGNDPFSLRARVVDRQKEMFISTFGNINTYASYICIVLPIFVAFFVFSKKLWVRIISGVLITEAAMAIIPAKSDNVYLGLGVAFIILFYIAIINKNFTEYIFAVLFMGVGLEIMAILNKIWSGSQKHINGIAQVVENPWVMLFFLILIAAVLIISMIFRGANYEMYKKVQSKKLLIVVSVLLVVGAVLVTIFGIKTHNSMFVFDDKWGTYRGYIWRRGWSLFVDANPLQKIFGYGNESIGKLMQSRYYSEMVEITGKKYDNLHNEMLQYLVTTGIFGVASYISVITASFIYIGKRMKDDPLAIACLASGSAYVAQGLVNLNQPITTPFFFVVIALGIGHIRYRDQGFGQKNI